jgi:uncharacterized protein
MTQPAKASEPSMEEILASIRRIIADDDATKSPAAAEAPKSSAEPPSPLPAPAMAAAPAAARAPEPSAFEEAVPPPPAAENVADADDQPGDILELTESMTAAEPMPSEPAPAAAAPQFRTIDADSDVGFDETPEPPPPPPPPQVKPARAEEPPKLLSPATSAAVDSAFNALAQTVLVQNARTLEDLVREMLRPLLKSWLDDNLPSLVERLVRAEIERVSRGR